jgi:hypothetical protein
MIAGMRGMRTLTVLVVALGLSGASLVPADGAPASARPQVSERAGGDSAPGVGMGDGDARVLVDDVIRPARSSVAARVRKWPGRTIPYFEKIPAKWDWSLDRAIAHWNKSGSKIKFVEVPRRKAKLVISYGDTGGADGVGTLGYQYRNYVYLSPAYKKADQYNPETRVWVGRLFAHELGHVLGFDHTPGQCALMYPVYNFGVCKTLAPGKPGYYNCRWIDKKLLRRFTKMYGGKPKRPPKLCLIEELPGQLRSVTFTGGNSQARPVKVTWVPPTTVRAGTKVYVTVWKGTSCSVAPNRWERRVAVDPKAGSWTDPAYGQGTWCYLVHIENRYGASQPASGRALARYAPVPAAPAVGTPTWRPQDGGWRFTWQPPLAGTALVALRNFDDPALCAPSFDAGSVEYLDQVGSTTWHLYAVAPQECLKFYVVTDWGTTSPAKQVGVVVPSSPAAPTPGPLVWDPDSYGFQFTWTPPDTFTSLRAMRNFDDPDTCPTTYDEDQADWLGQDYDTGKWLLNAYGTSECVSLFAVTSWGTVSDRKQITTQVPPPTVTPAVGASIVPYANDPAAGSTTASLASNAHSLGIEVLPGTCPTVVPNDLDWWDGNVDWDTPNLWYFYPEPWGSTTQQCALFAAVDGFGQHGPVVKRQFTLAAP